MSDIAKTNLSFVFDYYKSTIPHNLTYVYRGNFSSSLNEAILSLSESNLNNINEDSKVKKKVYFILVESLQNITRHEEKMNDSKRDNSSFFVIQKQGNSHLLTSGNIIENKNIASLKEKLDKVNSLGGENLKNYAKEIMTNGEFSDKGGAGLGLVEIARKSGNKLVYDFEIINNRFSYFYFHALISSIQQNFPNSHLEDAKYYHSLIREKKLNLVYQGHFSQENMKSILGMMEASVTAKGGLPIRKKIFNVLVEALQNIFKHGNTTDQTANGQNGIFIIGNSGNEYRITTGNVIDNSKVNDLKSKLELINSLDVEKLNNLYNAVISGEEFSGDNGAGLGLIDMKLKSGQNLIYEFNPMDDGKSFFSLQIVIADT